MAVMKQTTAVLLVFVWLCLAGGAAAQSRFERSAQRKQELVRNVVWPTHEPVMFSLRRGGHSDDLIETYARQHDPDNIKAQLAAGVKYGRLHFYKGFGIAYERTEIDKSIAMAEFMHRHGMKVKEQVFRKIFLKLLK